MDRRQFIAGVSVLSLSLPILGSVLVSHADGTPEIILGTFEEAIQSKDFDALQLLIAEDFTHSNRPADKSRTIDRDEFLGNYSATWSDARFRGIRYDLGGMPSTKGLDRGTWIIEGAEFRITGEMDLGNGWKPLNANMLVDIYVRETSRTPIGFEIIKWVESPL